jgi:hypothetical protein
MVGSRMTQKLNPTKGRMKPENGVKSGKIEPN